MVKIVFDTPEASENKATETLEPVQLTASAAKQIQKIMQKKQKENLKLRLTIKGGGCSGYSYYFDLTEEQNTDDYVISNTEYPSIHMLVDPASYSFVKGSIVDYKESLESSQFVVENPNAASSCGCGNSFSVK